MALFSSFNLGILFHAIILICSASSSKYVPVLIWGSVNNPEVPSALNLISQDDFKEILSGPLRNLKTSFLIFQEETLSTEDIKAEIYPRTSNLKNKATLSYFPSVELPTDVLHKLSKNVKELPIKELKNLKINPGQTVIVGLNDANDGEFREDMLNRHDGIIYSTSKDVLANNKNVIIIYTGKKASFQEPNENNSRQRRDTKAEEAGQSNHIMAYNQFIAMYASSNSYMVQEIDDKQTQTDKTITTYPLIQCTGKNDFTNNSTKLSFCLKDEKNNTVADKTVEFDFSKTATRYWVLESISMPVINTTDITYVRNTMNKVYAPIRFSYHCGKLTFTSVLKKTDPNTNKVLIEYTTKLVVPDFQAEFYDYSLNESLLTFDSAYDCVGFTSGPIWSGIFVTFILALIMTFGLCMIMDIKTMDRFDDPKGKTISINVSE